MLRVKDVYDGSVHCSDLLRISHALDAEYPRSRVLEGDVVISVQGSVGRVGIVPQALDCANISRTLARIRPLSKALGPWIAAALTSPQIQLAIREEIGGTTRDSLNIRDLRRLEVPCAPAAEQERLVGALSAIASRLSSAQDLLESARVTLARLREAVLLAACSGARTREWRTHQHAAESANGILRRIADARRRKSQSKSSREVDVVGEADPELPGTWVRCRIDQVAAVSLGGTPSRQSQEYWGGDIPWVSSGEVANCRIATTQERITQAGLENSNAKLYPSGTVLIAMIGEGKTRG